jgi:hypothetical protein
MTKIRLEPPKRFGPNLLLAERTGSIQGSSPLPLNMDSDSQDFFEELASCSRTGFKTRFSRTARRLGLNRGLSRGELARLYEAAFIAALCNISFNGLGGCGGEIRPDKEQTRCRLEQSFMDACDNFYRSPGWKVLKPAQKKSIHSIFLSVSVSEENLAH